MMTNKRNSSKWQHRRVDSPNKWSVSRTHPGWKEKIQSARIKWSGSWSTKKGNSKRISWEWSRLSTSVLWVNKILHLSWTGCSFSSSYRRFSAICLTVWMVLKFSPYPSWTLSRMPCSRCARSTSWPAPLEMSRLASGTTLRVTWQAVSLSLRVSSSNEKLPLKLNSALTCPLKTTVVKINRVTWWPIRKWCRLMRKWSKSLKNNLAKCSKCIKLVLWTWTKCLNIWNRKKPRLLKSAPNQAFCCRRWTSHWPLRRTYLKKDYKFINNRPLKSLDNMSRANLELLTIWVRSTVGCRATRTRRLLAGIDPPHGGPYPRPKLSHNQTILRWTSQSNKVHKS